LQTEQDIDPAMAFELISVNSLAGMKVMLAERMNPAEARGNATAEDIKPIPR